MRRLIPVLFTGWMAACSLLAPKLERPNVTVVGIQMVSGNLFQQNFLVTLNIDNPNNRTLPVTSLHAELIVAGEKIASGVNNSAFVVPARGSMHFDMTVTANAALALFKLSQHHDRNADTIDYQMTGSASIDLPFLRDLPFHRNGTFPLRLGQ